MSEELIIKRLSQENAADFLTFFDDRAFCDNPDWADCYCCFYYFPDNAVWGPRTSEQNRKCAEDYISSGQMNGFLAYSGGAVVGWCNADAKKNYPRILKEAGTGADDGEGVSVVCFVIDHEYRRRGIATKLLSEACSEYKKDGYKYIEAYPWKKQEGDAGNYHGPEQMYRAAGFSLHRETGDFLVLRKSLN